MLKDLGKFLSAGGGSLSDRQWCELLDPYVSKKRQEKIQRVLEGRSLDVVVVLEELFDAGNISAVMRSADSFGLARLHLVEQVKLSKRNRSHRGARDWLDLVRWPNIESCLKSLKNEGYLIATTQVQEGTLSVDDFKPTKEGRAKIAVVLGRERCGCSPKALELSDLNLWVPTCGFSESLNVSVAAAVMMQSLMAQGKKLGWAQGLGEDQLDYFRARYMARAIPDRHLQALVTRFAEVQETPQSPVAVVSL